jgi:hypothetical protein
MCLDFHEDRFLMDPAGFCEHMNRLEPQTRASGRILFPRRKFSLPVT